MRLSVPGSLFQGALGSRSLLGDPGSCPDECRVGATCLLAGAGGDWLSEVFLLGILGLEGADFGNSELPFFHPLLILH